MKEHFTAALPNAAVQLRIPCAGLFLAAMVGVIIGRIIYIPVEFWLSGGIFAALLTLQPRLAWMIWIATALTFAALQVGQSRDSSGSRLSEYVGDTQGVVDEVLIRVDEPFRSAGGGAMPRWRARGAVRVAASDGLNGWIPVLLNWQGGEPPEYGDQVRTRGSIRRIPAIRNPGEFDARAWYQLSGIYCEVTVDAQSGFEITGCHPNPLILLAIRSRAAVEHILQIGIKGTVESAVILGMTIGDTRDTPDELSDAFREVGVFHLFSVSGLHVGMIAAILWFLLGTAGVDKRKAAMVLIPCVFFYALLTGWKPASVRAATMVALVAGGLIFYRQPLAMNSLCAAGLILLGINTNELFNPGFQLSFTVVAAILIIAVPLFKKMEHLVAPDPFIPRQILPKWRLKLWEISLAVGGLISVSVAAWIGSLPLTVFYFNLVSLAAIPANILIVPLAFVSLSLAAGSLAGGWIFPLIADIANHANLLVTKLIITIVTTFSAIPGGHFYVAAPMPPGRELEVTVMDFGSGGASVIRTRSGVWLIDGGESYHGRTTLLRYLRSIGVNEIEGVVITHGDSRHLGGLLTLADRIKIRTAMESTVADRSSTRRKLRSQLMKAGIVVQEGEPGACIQLAAGIQLTVLFPPRGLDRNLADDKSLVIRLDAGEVGVLFLSDAGTFAESWLLEHAANELDSEIIVKGHPRDGDSGSVDFLRWVAPQVIIQAASNRSQSESVSPTLVVNSEKLEIPLLLQNKTGAVQIMVGRDGFEIRPFFGDPISEK